MPHEEKKVSFADAKNDNNPNTRLFERHRELIYTLLLFGSFYAGSQLYQSPESPNPSLRPFRRLALIAYALMVIIGALGMGISIIRRTRNSGLFTPASHADDSGYDSDSDNNPELEFGRAINKSI